MIMRRPRSRFSSPGTSVCALALVVAGCGGEEAAEESPTAAEVVAEAADAAPEAEDEIVESPAADGVERFTHWRPRHLSMYADVAVGVPVSTKEAMVLTADNHVGVTADAGATWHFSRLRNGRVYDIDGFADGPYLAVGADGYVAASEDGVHWRDLPRYTSDDLLDVVASELGAVAVGKRGTFVRYDKEGSTADVGDLPDGFKAKAIIEQSGAVVAYAGRKAYGTVDGETWTRFESDLDLPDDKVSLTAAGACSLGKVGENRGVVCSVTGTAYGISDGLAAVERNGIVALTRNEGRAWKTASLPFSGVNTIFGKDGGSLWAAGKGGNIAITKNDGKSWIDLEWEETADLNDALVDGDVIVLVGDQRTIAYSKDGGGTWKRATPEFGGNFTHVSKLEGKYVVTDGKIAVSSKDLSLWDEEINDLPVIPPAPQPCTELPGARKVCRFASGLTTPEGMPDINAFRFSGDVGVAWGDGGLVAFTGDGGASWNARKSLGLGALRLLAVGDQTVAISDGSDVAVSTDGGKTFTRGELDRKTTVNALLVDDAGAVYAAGKNGSLLVASGEAGSWTVLEPEGAGKVDFTSLYAVGGNFFASGSRGELWRSVDGKEWLAVEMGGAPTVQAMAGDGDTVFAVTTSRRDDGNWLLRSEDAGAHFFRVTELSHGGAAHDFRYDEGTLRYRDRISTDGGITWRRAVDRYWAGAEPIGDDSGKSLVSYADRYGKDPLYVVGDGEDDWVLIEGAFSENATVRCAASTGCWMIADGVLYRPG